MRLFADRGFGATSVADIEKAVGLQPRRGGLYKHFPNKLAVLETAIQAHLDSAASLARDVEGVGLAVAPNVDLSTLADQIEELGRAFLAEMDRLELLTRVLEHDAGRLPEFTNAVKSGMVDLSYRTTAQLLREYGPHVRDPEATAVVLLGPLVALRRTAWTFRAPPLDMDDDRFLKAWAESAVAVLTA
jgi:AcrR family transcriptional regulator